VTASTTGQITGGYAGVKGLCETACTSTSAHMCTSDEIVRTVQVGVAAPAGWYSVGLWSYNGISNAVDSDCTSWTSNSATANGYWWTSTFSTVQLCSMSGPVLCCD
jgi:hypothetical protein